ncbi:MAG TPA: acetolactate synthase large subunit [Burkholderiales bacterium]|nr:acetolactate synthase large subunit [Burkholderiales bacterium]
MNGAEGLIRTLLACGVDTCFTNPGTSEMHFVAALDRIEGMRCVLGLFEGVVTGAADGYGRMKDRPASTLLHLGPGLGNGLANLHNARRAMTPIVNVVGDHAIDHVPYDPPLASDIEGIARSNSRWVKTTRSPQSVGADAAEAVAASLAAPGGSATLILPADVAWTEGAGVAKPLAPPARRKVDEARVRAAAEALRRGNGALVLNGPMLRAGALELCGSVAAATGAELLCPTQMNRAERGAGRVNVDRIPYVVEAAQKRLAHLRTLVLVNSKPPVNFFAYPGKPPVPMAPGCEVLTLAGLDEDGPDAVLRLIDLLDAARKDPRKEPLSRPDLPSGPITLNGMAAVIAALMPEQAIVVDESITSGRGLVPATRNAPPHDWLVNPGGSIGFAMPCSVGAAVACPDRKVLCLQSDGSGMYTNQALWTMARESLDIVTLVFANRTYEILKGELRNVGAGEPGRKARNMLEIGRPDLDWVSLAKAQGVPGVRVDDLDALARELGGALKERGPRLIEIRM